MAYFCYVFPNDGGTPHMEALPALSLVEAQMIARAMLAERPGAPRAELWDDEHRVAVVARDAA